LRQFYWLQSDQIFTWWTTKLKKPMGTYWVHVSKTLANFFWQKKVHGS